jgi:hypothetical protein
MEESSMNQIKKIQYWKEGEKITEIIEPRQIESLENHLVRSREDKKDKSVKRPFKIQPSSRVRGYRVEKPGLPEPLFLRKYSVAVLAYCAGVFQSPGIFSGRGGKIEAVR